MMPFLSLPAMRLASLITIAKHQAQISSGVVQLQVLKSILTLGLTAIPCVILLSARSFKLSYDKVRTFWSSGDKY